MQITPASKIPSQTLFFLAARKTNSLRKYLEVEEDISIDPFGSKLCVAPATSAVLPLTVVFVGPAGRPLHLKRPVHCFSSSPQCLATFRDGRHTPSLRHPEVFHCDPPSALPSLPFSPSLARFHCEACQGWSLVLKLLSIPPLSFSSSQLAVNNSAPLSQTPSFQNVLLTKHP